MQEYPKAKYHKVHGGTCVHNEKEEAALGSGWVDSPAEFGVVTAPSKAQLREKELAAFPATNGEVEEEAPVEQEAEEQPAEGEEDAGILGTSFGRRRKR